MDEHAWDRMYASREQVFSGAPNWVLVAEAAGLPPGQALDMGCGEGADALWLARRGWLVTAVDVSRTALRRAAAAGAEEAGRVAWTHADLASAPLPAGAFDLVSVQYFPLRRAEPDELRTLVSAVAPGGTLLVVSHDLTELEPRDGFDPDDYYRPSEVAAVLDEGWTVLADETRPRPAPPPEGTHHTRDTVLLARRAR
ncbi:class I SAM-dependent methyltransferase [Streptomonospora sp. S1-112]|uniref:Class I SAM-dependent methyltransferase n=1 Tax=Streptomonospora mangrovi TaxID=2883123 RepID=A0A9X3NJL7_9ACTN|nr:class I SAM-dependent methyltransferase [Streptomonospora mangrovi]MDA0564235.1 class I SAM-dependent methyltransferase [Streptomonospora mangrovi]